jgi:aspartate kinase
VVWKKTATEPFVEELRQHYELVTTRPAAMVCVIGSNIAIPGVLARAAQVLADNKVNVNCVSQSLRQINMQFVIEREDYRRAVAALNAALCLGRPSGASA